MNDELKKKVDTWRHHFVQNPAYLQDQRARENGVRCYAIELMEATAHLYYLMDEVDRLKKQLERAKDTMKKASNGLDKMYFDVDISASVASMDEDEFYSIVGFNRDILDEALTDIEEME